MFGEIKLRRWRRSDLSSLVKYANDYAVWINLRDRFPYPYTRSDGEYFLARAADVRPESDSFAIDLAGEAIGGAGLQRHEDVHRIAAEIGYWLGQPFWGKGYATQAVRQLVAYGFGTYPLERIQACVFDWNRASERVLEKCGFTLEARLRRYVIKDARVGDMLIYALLRNP